ncbi:MAG: glycosyltransferase family 4 protein [Clostridium cadaveris]|uniref:glycosyltransferase family 4 protein n=1 Tax=Clostridium cadaveris TaxID=1529 RepID=UPI002A8A6F4D|nr:glycosyltransferase family 4 protein [Clostridium cadaveris]
MKILFFISNLKGKGGAERALCGIANEFQRNGYDVTILVEHGKKDEVAYELLSDIHYRFVPNNKKNNNIFEHSIQIRNIILNEIKPDIVISFLALSNIRLLTAIKKRGIPIVVCERNNPVTDPTSKIKQILRNYLYKYANHIIVQTQDAKKYFSKNLQDKITIIPNFVDCEKLPQFFEVNRKKKIVSVGRLSKQKNQQLLIDAFCTSDAISKGYELIIYGTGNLYKELKKKIIENKVEDKIYIHNPIDNLLETIKSDEIFILSSDYEGMPNVLIEAMCLGMACISTNCPCGGPEYLIEDHINGILIPVGKKEEMVRAINELINDEKLRLKLGNNAIKIREKLSLKKIFKIWEKTVINL